MYNLYRFVQSIPEGDIMPLYWTGGDGWSGGRNDALTFFSLAEAADVSNTFAATTWIIESWKNPAQ